MKNKILNYLWEHRLYIKMIFWFVMYFLILLQQLITMFLILVVFGN